MRLEVELKLGSEHFIIVETSKACQQLALSSALNSSWAFRWHLLGQKLYNKYNDLYYEKQIILLQYDGKLAARD